MLRESRLYLSRKTTFISARQKPSDHVEFIPSFLSRKVKNKESLQIFRAPDWAYPARSFPPLFCQGGFLTTVMVSLFNSFQHIALFECYLQIWILRN